MNAGYREVSGRGNASELLLNNLESRGVTVDSIEGDVIVDVKFDFSEIGHNFSLFPKALAEVIIFDSKDLTEIARFKNRCGVKVSGGITIKMSCIRSLGKKISRLL